MSLTEKIHQLRKQHNMSQEQLAGKLGISRQAVSKWESGQSMPDTDKIIQLSKIFNVTADYLLKDEDSSKATFVSDNKVKFQGKRSSMLDKLRRNRKMVITATFIFTIVALLISAYFTIALSPVSWDAGACSGGFATAVFDQYESELLQKFIQGQVDNPDSVSNPGTVHSVRESREVTWEGRTIYINFNIVANDGVYKVRFVGKKVWLQKYKWGGCIIEEFTPTLSLSLPIGLKEQAVISDCSFYQPIVVVNRLTCNEI